jgi:Family of unknown function (DUF6263)
MKKIPLITAFLLTSLSMLAQSPTLKIVLNKNQQLKFVSSIKGNISQEMMGQSMETIMDINNTRNIIVQDINAENYQLDAVTTHIKMNMSVMGQEKTFDSNNKDDMAGDMKDAGKSVNQVKKFILSADGRCRADEKDTVAKNEETAAEGMMTQMFGTGMEATGTESYFMLIPAGKKTGDSWADSVITGSVKLWWTYTWEANAGDIAIIKATGKSSSNSTINTQGMEVTINLTNDIVETRKADLKSGIVIHKESISKLNGTAEVMGQSVPMSGTTTTTITLQ